MMLLGGGATGENNALKFCTAATPRTVVGYLSQVIAGGAGALAPAANSFILNVNKYNSHMPKNLFLLCGDGNLEPMAPAINLAASAPALTPAANPWLWVHQIFRRLIENLEQNENWMVFIDTNPSFSIYTEIAVSGADSLIVPVNADDSSRVATNAMFVLLHGTTPPHPIYGAWTYAERAKTAKMPVPKVHLIIGNRLTQYSGAAAAYKALSDATADTLYTAYKSHPQYFTKPTAKIADLDEFRGQYSVALRDFNTAGVVSAHLGQPISSMKQAYYPVHGAEVKVSADQVREAQKAIDIAIGRLV